MSGEAESWPPLILAVAPNGARRTRADHTALPIAPAEIAAAAAACLAAGAALVAAVAEGVRVLGRPLADAETTRGLTAA